MKLLCLALLTAALFSTSPPGRAIQLGDNGRALINPGMGWVFHYYDNSLDDYGRRLRPADTLDQFPGMAVAYMRLAWSHLEPAKGKFNWDLIDSPAREWLQHGKRIAFRFTSAESQEPVFATPEWVKKAGAKGYYFDPGKGVVADSRHWEPDYDDPVFLSELDQFLAAVAARYDGKPGLDFVDVGSFGVWGEGHTLSSTLRPYRTETLRRIIDLYRKHFRRTLLACNDDFALQGRGTGIVEYCRDRGLTLRDDSILVGRGNDAYLSASLAQKFWANTPVILESQYYNIPRDEGYWDAGRKYFEAVEAYRASYVSAHWDAYEFLKDNRKLIDRINLRLGYRLVLESVTLPGHLSPGAAARIEYRIRNAGVAPCLPGGRVAFTLISDSGVRHVFLDRTLDIRNLTRPESRIFNLPVPALSKGRYSIWFSIGGSAGNPVFELPLNLTASGRRYRLGFLDVS